MLGDLPQVPILGIPFHKTTSKEASAALDGFMRAPKQHIVVTPNPEMLLESLQNERLRAVLQKADLALPDGIGILWAAKFLSLPKRGRFRTWLQWKMSLLSVLFYPRYIRSVLPERVTGVDTMKQICGHSVQINCSIFLLGGSPGVAEQAKIKLEQQFPGIRIAGTDAGRPFTEDDQVILQKINDSKPQILFVAFGAPKQEIWIDENLSKMPSVKIAMGIGGSFDFISGIVKRAPVGFQKLGLEWLWRLFQEPRKRIPRIWNAVVVFPWKVLRYKINSRKS